MLLRNKRGFTLIELIVVMAIMAILASITYMSVNSMIQKNKYDANVFKMRDAIELCDTNVSLLNQGIGSILGYEYVASGDNVTKDNFRGMIMGRISSQYDIRIVEEGTIPSMTASSLDIIVVYISGLGQPLNRDIELIVEGAWFIRKGESTPYITYNQTERSDYEEAKVLS